MINKELIIIGYSGHAYVCLDIAISKGYNIYGYCEANSNLYNPFNIDFLGSESDEKNTLKLLKKEYFIGIGNNQTRMKIQTRLENAIKKRPINLFHDNVSISKHAVLKGNGILVMPNVIINAFAEINKGVICNTASIIEHECKIGAFAHIGPGAVLAGNVTVGKRTFIGANSVVKQGIVIGKDVIIGAGSVIINDIPDNVTVVGNPGRMIKNSTI